MKHLTIYENMYATGATIFKEGDLSKDIYVIKSGHVNISKTLAGEERIIAQLGPGDFFGEMSSFTNEPRSANATTTAVCVVIKFFPEQLNAMIKKNHQIALKMIKHLAMRIAQCNSNVALLHNKDSQSRIALYILQIYSKHQIKGQDEKKTIPLELEKMQSHTGILKERIQESLNKMSLSNLVQYNNKEITIPDIRTLKDYFIFLTEQALEVIE